MTVEEIFSALAAHMVKGFMIHDQMATAYNFLGLKGYKKCHEYHYYEESMNYRKLQNYFVEEYNKLIPESKIDNPNIIPQSWLKYSRENVDANNKRAAIREMMKKWVDWEEETKNKLQSFYKELYDMEEICAAKKMMFFLNCVDKELKRAREKYIIFESIGYDIVAICAEQNEYHQKYEEKINRLFSDD